MICILRCAGEREKELENGNDIERGWMIDMRVIVCARVNLRVTWGVRALGPPNRAHFLILIYNFDLLN